MRKRQKLMNSKKGNKERYRKEREEKKAEGGERVGKRKRLVERESN